MTGDGVNDAPALKKADCGIAVSGATDAARAAASIVLITPGLTVIIDAIKESRKIFQRMNSYAIYRIAETLRVLLFVTAIILVVNFFPVTAMQIVLLALLNDGAILSIAYDNVRYRDQPEAWNMRVVLGMATILGVVGPVAAFGMFYLGDRVFHLGRPELQTLMYLTLSVAGHLTIFQARTRGPFWSIRPARILVLAVIGTQALATCIAVWGIFMTPLGWRYAALVWGYALVWFVVTDRVKVLGYRGLDPSHGGDVTASPRGLSRADLAAMAASVPSFHTEVDPRGDELVYHDSQRCPYGREITRDAHATPGAAGRRRCAWCEGHARVALFHSTSNVGDSVDHDLCACPYAQSIVRDGHATRSFGGRRKCEWCRAHASRAEVSEGSGKERTG
jgi:H+-transporting ATPase